jgi:hypothetical protein
MIKCHLKPLFTIRVHVVGLHHDAFDNIVHDLIKVRPTTDILKQLANMENSYMRHTVRHKTVYFKTFAELCRNTFTKRKVYS